MQYSNLFFDLDRTLWDFKKNNECTFAELFAYFSLPENFGCSFEELYRIYNVINNQLWEDYREGRVAKEVLLIKRFRLLFEHFNATPYRIQEMSDFYLQESPKKNHLIPNSLEILTYLKTKGYRLHIITNGFKEVQYLKLESAHISGFFDKVFISEEVGFPKPDKRVFEFALQAAKCPAAEALMIGDDYKVDIEGAARAGLSTIYCNFEEGKPYPNMASHTIRSLNEIPTLL